MGNMICCKSETSFFPECGYRRVDTEWRARHKTCTGHRWSKVLKQSKRKVFPNSASRGWVDGKGQHHLYMILTQMHEVAGDNLISNVSLFFFSNIYEWMAYFIKTLLISLFGISCAFQAAGVYGVRDRRSSFATLEALGYYTVYDVGTCCVHDPFSRSSPCTVVDICLL